MRLLCLLLLFSLSAFAENSPSEANCTVIKNGIYINSQNTIEEFRFESLLDNFSLNSAKNFSIMIDGVRYRFLRTTMNVNDYTKMTFITTKRNSNRAAIVQIDRSPRKALSSKEFIGNLVISQSVSNEGIVNETERTLTYNFSCQF